jgi:glycine cleavage system H protein
MNVDYCEFPDELYYDVENDVWFRELARDHEESAGLMGVSSIFVFLAGKITSLSFRPISGGVSRGKSIATLESVKYVGAVRSPVDGAIESLNVSLVSNPVLISKSPYENWIAEYSSFNSNSLKKMLKGKDAEKALRARIEDLHIHCFKVLPDDEMYSIGTECATTLANLNQLLEDKPQGYSVHLVTDDPTSDIELVRWSRQTGNILMESRNEQNLYHFVVRKS